MAFGEWEMANKTIEDFFGELKTNEELQERLKAQKAESLEELARVTGGVAREYGYEFQDEEILGFYNQQESLLRKRSDDASLGIAGIKDWIMDEAKSCGAREQAMRPLCPKALKSF